jgi:hypothetical protein
LIERKYGGMGEGVYDPEALIDEIESLEPGKLRLMGIKRAIEEADRAKDEDYSFLFRYEYVQESTFGGDHYDSILMFPELLVKFDAMGERGYKFAMMLLGAFEWVLQDAIYFYQVSQESMDNYFKDYLKRAMMFGKSPHMYLLILMESMRHGNADKIPEIMKTFRRITNDGMTLYEMHESVKFELISGNVELALRYAEFVWSEGEKEPQAEIPGKTYGYFAEYHMNRGEYEKAANYADKMLPYITDGSSFFFYEYFTLAIDIFRVTDNLRAHELWKRFNPNYEDCKNPALRFFWGAVSYRLFKESDKESDKKLSQRYYTTARKIGEKFDKRNGNDFFCDFLDMEIV